MKRTRIIVQQFDPESSLIGGINTCIRDMCRAWGSSEKIILLGVSKGRPLLRLQQVDCGGSRVGFIPVARLHPTDRRRVLPHSLRVAIGTAVALLVHPELWRGSLWQTHRTELTVLAVLLRRRVLQFIHTDTEAALGPNSDSLWRYAPKLYAWFERFVCRRCAATVAFNKSTARRLSEPGVTIRSSTTWFDEVTFENRNRSDRAGVLWVGRFEGPKNPLLALEAFALIAEERPLLGMLMIGSGSLLATIETRVDSLGLREKVLIRKPVTPRELAEAMNASAVMLMTSHFEGSPRTLFEGAACGLAVLATDTADPDRLVLDGELGVTTASDPASLCEGYGRLPRALAPGASVYLQRYTAKKVLGDIAKWVDERVFSG